MYVCKCIGMCRPEGNGFLRRFGLKKGTHFSHFGLDGIGYEKGHFFCLKEGHVLENRAAHPHLKFPGVTSRVSKCAKP